MTKKSRAIPAMACHQHTLIPESARASRVQVLLNAPLHPGACSRKGGQQANDIAGHADLKDLFIGQGEKGRYYDYVYK